MMIGIDEVGRGCWAGPLVAAAVLLDHNFSVSKARPWKLGDSKRLTKAQREVSAGEIQDIACEIGVGWVEPTEVDELGLTEAVRTAMRRAVEKINYEGHEIVIDGNVNYLSEITGTQAIIKADGSIPAVSAASIIAKVARDEHMKAMSLEYPGYAFEKHVGYGTKLHLQALRQFGATPIHRRSYKPIQAFL